VQAFRLRFHPLTIKMLASEFMNERYIKWYTPYFGKWRGHDWNYWQDMLPYCLSRLWNW